MASGVVRELKKETFWRRMVRGQVGSGLSIRAWCRRRRLNEASFYRWRAALARRDRGLSKMVLVRAKKSASARSAFVPVRVADDEAVNGDGRIEIVLAGGQQVRVSGRVDRQMLADVLAVLEGLVC